MKNTIEKALQRQKAEREAENKKTKAEMSGHRVQNTVEPAEQITSKELSDNTTGSQYIEDSAKAGTRTELSPFTLKLKELSDKGHISVLGERKQINEEYREIKRKLIANAFGALAKTLNNPNIIMVTSSRPSEGKTFTATNLALSIAAEQDKTVLLVDADVLKPNVLNTLGLERRKGLMEYLSGDVEDISEVLYPTNIDKLKIIPAGKSHHLSTEMLASQKMHETVDEFANRYPDRIVIFDTPPLIGINESAILANFAGQAVVVVEEGKTKINDIKMSVERLNPEMAIGFVVNKSIHHDTDGSGYYGYYYAEREN
ncbi:tyrosine-protein kinase family protein [Alteromonas sp. BL110]|uniref:XrtA-associated tyrosine autokinase n=1 Tax=Alteromonas sp. BL110 TaxID=1714845 RepID=UPI000E4910F3|nr:XrtA-associated tyrosine autokinase [Alteromonas sp. BL110]AXT39634.1 tyrosine-protein kinase family protein [Alteromonas sp. BL110]RKM81879.1 polysaccharide biosynthesis tyrosine autokinase [Alteromonas sp. BL110]